MMVSPISSTATGITRTKNLDMSPAPEERETYQGGRSTDVESQENSTTRTFSSTALNERSIEQAIIQNLKEVSHSACALFNRSTFSAALNFASASLAASAATECESELTYKLSSRTSAPHTRIP